MTGEDAEHDRLNETIRGLVRDIESHNPSRIGHAERVSSSTVATGFEMGVRDHELLALRYASVMHDVWKLPVKREILEKAGPLDGAERLDTVALPLACAGALKRNRGWQWADLMGRQYVWFDGSSKHGLKGENIPLGSRILFVATAFDVMTWDQPWRKARTEEEALEELKRCAGAQFDPAVVEAFLKVQPLLQPIRDV